MEKKKCNYRNCKINDPSNLKSCPGCKNVYYDSLECLKKDKKHQRLCNLTNRLKKHKSKDLHKKMKDRAIKHQQRQKNRLYKIDYNYPLGFGSCGKVIFIY